jgi:hypothetical protein
MHGFLAAPCFHYKQWILLDTGGTVEYNWGSCMTDFFSQLHLDYSHEKFSGKENIFWIFLLRDALGVYEGFMRKKLPFGYCFSETSIL